MHPVDHPPDHDPPGGPAAPPRRGFAIIISIFLLSFIVLLLLSLVLMIRVGTQTSVSLLKDEQAKRNALFGLNMAISQLQKYAGPDQRTTVRADFGDTTLNTQLSPIKFHQTNPGTSSIASPTQVISEVSVPADPNLVAMGLPATFAPGTRMWTAVFGNADPGGLIFVKTPTPVLLNWLVSGIELPGASNSQTLSSLYGQINAFGPISQNEDGTIAYPDKYSSYLKALPYTPDATVTSVPQLADITTTTYAMASLSGNQLQVSSPNGGTTRGVLLVGPATTGTLSFETITYSTGNLITLSGKTTSTKPTGQFVIGRTFMADRFVVAPVVTLSVSGSLVPGFSGADPKAIGSYAWYVQDEGIKAKVNVRDMFDTGGNPNGQMPLLGAGTDATTTYSARLRVQVMPRFGIETVTGMRPSGETGPTDVDIPAALNDFYPVDATADATSTLSPTSSFAISRIFSPPQLRYTDPSGGAPLLGNQSDYSGALPVLARYHDFTTYSYGVLADSQRGGLRRDLTAILGDNAVFANYGNNGSNNSNGVNLLPDFDEPQFNSASQSIPAVGGVTYNLDPGELDPALQDSNFGSAEPTSTNPRDTQLLSGQRVSPKSQYIYGPAIFETDGPPIRVENHAPTWDKVMNFYRLGLTNTLSGPAAPVQVQAADARHAPLTPVILQCRVFFNAGIVGVGTFGMRVYVAIVVANPYSQAIEASKGLNFIFREPGLPNSVAGINGGSSTIHATLNTLGGRGAWIVALSDYSDYKSGATGTTADVANKLVPSGTAGFGEATTTISPFATGNPKDLDLTWKASMILSAQTFGNNFFVRGYSAFANPGFGYPILNSGMTNSANSTDPDIYYRFERNWLALPDPAPSILGSVVLHASDTGKLGASLTIPAGQAETLVVNTANSGHNGKNNGFQTVLTRDVIGGRLGTGAMTFTQAGEIEMEPVANLGIQETVSTTATASQITVTGTGGVSLADFYYVYDTQFNPTNLGLPVIPFSNRYSECSNGDNVSLYMLDPNYGSGFPAGNAFLPGDSAANYTANGGTFFVGRPLAAVIGVQYMDGERPAGLDSVKTAVLAGDIAGGNKITNSMVWNYVSSNGGSGSSTQGLLPNAMGYQPQLTGYDGGAFFFQADLPESRTLWNQATGDTKLFYGNFYRTLIDYGLTNVFHAQPLSTGSAQFGVLARPIPPNALVGYLGWLMGVSKQDNDPTHPWGFDLYSVGYGGSLGWADDVSTAYSESSTIFDDIPRRLYNKPSGSAGNREEPILSVGYLRNLNLSGDDEYLNPGYQPDSQIGNSYFNPYLTRLATVQPVTQWLEPATFYNDGANEGLGVLPTVEEYDMTYLLNSAFWDTYFFSTIPLDSNSGLPNNRRLKFAAGINPTLAELGVGPGFADTANPTSGSPTVPDAIQPGVPIPKEYAASRSLLIDGAFNVNSTSIEAWRALLSGLRGRAVGPTDAELLEKLSAFPRTLFEPPVPNGNGSARAFSADSTSADATVLNNNSVMGAYAGFRRLTDEQIEALATNIVLEIRKRGPVVSLAEFINRSGVSNAVKTGGSFYSTDPTSALDVILKSTGQNVIQDTDTMAGRLQIAIERSGLNSAQPSEIEPTEDDASSIAYDAEFLSSGRTIPAMDYASGVGDDESDSLHNPLYQDYFPEPGTFAQLTLNRSVGIPGWFCQADLLQPLGPVLAARSDTFVIRAYGDVFDAIDTVSTLTPIVQGRAWCEAVVQREPDYVNGADVPSTYPAIAKPDNAMFGRKFRIVSFRWLSPNDI